MNWRTCHRVFLILVTGAAILMVIIAQLLMVGCGQQASTAHESSSGEETSASNEQVVARLVSDASLPDMTDREYHNDCLASGCHAQLSLTRWVHAPGAIGACSVCHEPLGEPNGHQFAPVADDGSACLPCHSLDDTAESVHEPFAMGACSDCHDPHGGDRKSFIRTRTTEELCATCHDQIAVGFPHHPVVEGDCLTCHSAHESRQEHLLVYDEKELCMGCHQNYGRLLVGRTDDDGRPVQVHQALDEGGCRACHVAHGGDHTAMLTGGQRSVCMSCHEEVVSEIALANSLHGAFEGEEACTVCHASHASQYDGLLRDAPGDLCFTCHDQDIETPSGRLIPSIKEVIEEAMVVHEPAANGECTTCHQSHYSAQRSLLRFSYPDGAYAMFESETFAMCLECHDRVLVESEYTSLTSFREGDRNLHYVHVNREKGRACDICHQPHAGQLPMLMRESFPFGPGGWDMPLGFVKTDEGGFCIAACHEQRWYDNTYTLDLFPSDR